MKELQDGRGEALAHPGSTGLEPTAQLGWWPRPLPSTPLQQAGRTAQCGRRKHSVFRLISLPACRGLPAPGAAGAAETAPSPPGSSPRHALPAGPPPAGRHGAWTATSKRKGQAQRGLGSGCESRAETPSGEAYKGTRPIIPFKVSRRPPARWLAAARRSMQREHTAPNAPRSAAQGLPSTALLACPCA